MRRGLLKMMKKITKDMTFAEIMEVNKDAGNKLADRGLFCGGCPMAAFETVENGAKAHGVDVEELLEELNSEDKKDSKGACGCSCNG